MLMIVAYHSFHYVSTSNVVYNEIWREFIRLLGMFVDDIFVLISAYFLIKSDTTKFIKLFNLWLRVFFYSVTFFLLFFISGIAKINVIELVKVFMPITTNQWWFVSFYFALYVTHSWWNSVLRNLTRENYKKFLVILITSWSIVRLTNMNISFKSVITFLCLYSIAGYIRLWADDFGNKKYIWLGFLFLVLNLFAIKIFGIVELHTPLGTKGAYPVSYFVDMIGIFNLLASVCMLIGFKNLNLKQNKTINTIASATLGVFLIHYHRYLSPFLWETCFKFPSVHNSPYLIPYSIAVILFVYVACTLIELLRSKIFKYISNGKLS